MRHSLPKRSVALLGALLYLAFSAGEGFGLHPCPYHEAGEPPEQVAAEAHGAHTPSAGAAHTDHGHHTGSPAPAGPTEEPQPAHHSGSDPCTHFEACQSATGAVLHVDVHWDTVWADSAPAIAGILPDESALPSSPAHTLPFAQAPPISG